MRCNAAFVQFILDSLHYPFDQFEINHFVQHVSQQRGKDILINEFPFAGVGLHGLWTPADTADYVFINQNLHPIHKTHVKLHELGHILLDHQCHLPSNLFPSELLVPPITTPARLRMAMPPSLVSDPQEQECELFVALIQRRLLEKRRLEELMGQSSSIAGLRPYTDAANYVSPARKK